MREDLLKRLADGETLAGDDAKEAMLEVLEAGNEKFWIRLAVQLIDNGRPDMAKQILENLLEEEHE